MVYAERLAPAIVAACRDSGPYEGVLVARELQGLEEGVRQAAVENCRLGGMAEQLQEHGFVVVPDFVPDAEWRALARDSRELYRRGEFRHAGVGRGPSFRIEPETRNDRVRWIDPGNATRQQARWLARVEALRLNLNERLFLGAFGLESHLALYPPGARYRTHLDRFADASHRIVSLILYLNEDWRPEDGGALRLYRGEPDRPPWHDVLPVGGTLAAFLSGEIQHGVLPATRERLSVVGWLTGRR